MRHYFDVETGDLSYVDEYGTELACAEEARLEAHGLASALVGDRRTSEDAWSMTIRVRDGEDARIYELRLDMSGRMLTASEDVMGS